MVLVTAYCVAAEPPVAPTSGEEANNIMEKDDEKRAVDPWTDDGLSARR